MVSAEDVLPGISYYSEWVGMHSGVTGPPPLVNMFPLSLLEPFAGFPLEHPCDGNLNAFTRLL